MNLETAAGRLEEVADASRERLGDGLSECVLHHCQSINALRSLITALLGVSPTLNATQHEAVQLITRVIITGVSANTFSLAGHISPDTPMIVICREIDLILNTMHETHNDIQKGRTR